jgi:hypothetical protein
MLKENWDLNGFWEEFLKDVDLDPTVRPVAKGTTVCRDPGCLRTGTCECCICGDAICTLHVQIHPTMGATFCLTHWLRHGPNIAPAQGR